MGYSLIFILINFIFFLMLVAALLTSEFSVQQKARTLFSLLVGILFLLLFQNVAIRIDDLAASGLIILFLLSPFLSLSALMVLFVKFSSRKKTYCALAGGLIMLIVFLLINDSAPYQNAIGAGLGQLAGRLVGTPVAITGALIGAWICRYFGGAKD